MSLSHRLFGIRSCNETIDGRRGRPCLEYDIKRCLAPCVDVDLQPRALRRGRRRRAAVPRRAHGRTARGAGPADGRGGGRGALRGGGAPARRGAHGPDASRPPAEDGVGRARRPRRLRHQDRPGGRRRPGVPGAPRPRGRAREPRRRNPVGRIQNGTPVAELESPDDPAEVLQATLPQFYADREVPPEIHLPLELPDAESIEAWLTARAGRRVRVVVPKRGDKRGLLDLAARNADAGLPGAVQPGRRGPLRRPRDAARRARPAGAAAADRVLRHLHHPGAARRSPRWSSAKTAG